MTTTYIITRSDELYHHGISGQKWGIRRYQNPDGTLTEEGKKRYSISDYRADRKQYHKDAKKLSKLAKSADRQAQQRIVERESSKAKKQFVKGVITGGTAAAGLLFQNNWKEKTPWFQRQVMFDDDDMRQLDTYGHYAVGGLAALGIYHVGKGTYHAIKASVAKRKVSDLGHDKAVEKYKTQVNKMIDRFSGTPYEEQVKKQVDRYQIDT